jgi:hypothetical protein
MKKSATILLGCVLNVWGCTQFPPPINVKVKAVLPCDQPDALEGVGIMQIRAVDEGGKETKTQGTRSSGKATLKDLTIADGTTLFINGFPGEDTSAVDGIPSAAGVSVPLQLATFQKSKKFPAARNYPDGTSATIAVPMGKVNTFASTTDVDSNSCSALGQARHGHTATFSSTIGKVVIIGGFSYAASDGAEAFVPRDRAVELYDPATGTFEAADVPSNIQAAMQRAYHTATALPDGTILVWGGIGAEGTAASPTLSARQLSFVLNPSDFSITPLGPGQGFSLKRFNHQATLLKSGVAVVMTGGCGCKGSLTDDKIKAGECPSVTDTCSDGQLPRVAAVDIFDTASKTIRTVTTGVLDKPRAFHSAVALASDFIVIVGGDDGQAPVKEVEIFRYASGQPTLIKPVSDKLDSSAVTRASAVAISSTDCTLLVPTHPADTECVLLTGGCLSLPNGDTCSMVQSGSTLIDMGKMAGSRKETGPAGNRARWGHEAFYLPSGNNMVMVAGGKFDVQPGDNIPISAEVLARRPATGGGPTPFAPAPPPFMKHARKRFASTVFPSGQVLFTGGVDSASTGTTRTSLSSAELFFFPFQ